MGDVSERGCRSRGGLVSHNVVVRGKRTSMRLESEFWDALEEVCRRERIEAGELIRRAERGREGSTRTGAVRAHLLT